MPNFIYPGTPEHQRLLQEEQVIQEERTMNAQTQNLAYLLGCSNDTPTSQESESATHNRMGDFMRSLD